MSGTGVDEWEVREEVLFCPVGPAPCRIEAIWSDIGEAVTQLIIDVLSNTSCIFRCIESWSFCKCVIYRAATSGTHIPKKAASISRLTNSFEDSRSTWVFLPLWLGPGVQRAQRPNRTTWRTVTSWSGVTETAKTVFILRLTSSKIDWWNYKQSCSACRYFCVLRVGARRDHWRSGHRKQHAGESTLFSNPNCTWECIQSVDSVLLSKDSLRTDRDILPTMTHKFLSRTASDIAHMSCYCATCCT